MVNTTLTIALRPDVAIAIDGASVRVTAPSLSLTWEQLAPPLLDFFRHLAEGVLSPALASMGADPGGHFLTLPMWYSMQHELDRSGVLQRTVSFDGAPVATVVPLAAPFVFGRLDERSSWRLSRFAHVRRQGDELIVESPRASARIVLHGPLGVAALAALVRPVDAAALALALQVSEPCAHELLRCFCSAGAAHGDDGEDDLASPLAWWEFHDLLFHSRSRQGRHGNPYGGTFHRKGKAPPPPLVKPAMAGELVALARPDLAARADTEPAFGSVLEARRSLRNYDEAQPVTLAELSEFLFRTVRIQQVIATPPDDMDYSYRPSPGGGAIHELEVYPVVGNCAGLAQGVYHYDPLEHRLRRVVPAGPAVDALLQLAWITADRKSSPNVYFVLTARFQRLQWKYQSMVYSAVLKNVGALYQTMYLVATAMQLAPCSLGGGNSDRFGELLGLDPYQESAVGEFVLGRRRAGDGA